MGVGALFVRRRPRVRLEPLVHGGGQERGFRAGTLPLPLIVGLAEAVTLAQTHMQSDADKHVALRDALLEALAETTIPFSVNGSMEHRLPGNINLSFPEIAPRTLVCQLGGCGNCAFQWFCLFQPRCRPKPCSYGHGDQPAVGTANPARRIWPLIHACGRSRLARGAG